MEQSQTVAIPTEKPRCYLLYAIAPKGTTASVANQTINELIGDPKLPLALWHDHFLGGPGGCVIFYVENKSQQTALFENTYLTDWRADYRPMVFSFSPSAFDAQIGYTTSAYRGLDWDAIRKEDKPDYGGRDTFKEAQTAEEC